MIVTQHIFQTPIAFAHGLHLNAHTLSDIWKQKRNKILWKNFILIRQNRLWKNSAESKQDDEEEEEQRKPFCLWAEVEKN